MKTLGKSATILAGTAAAFVAVMGATGAAEAKGKHFKFGGGVHKHHFHKHHFRRHHFYAGPVIVHGCGYEKRMWWKTGSYYWKNRYYTCKGWW